MAIAIEETETQQPSPPAPSAVEPVPLRLLVALALPVAAAAIMAGGVFQGASGRVYAIVAGFGGIALAAAAHRWGVRGGSRRSTDADSAMTTAADPLSGWGVRGGSRRSTDADSAMTTAADPLSGWGRPGLGNAILITGIFASGILFAAVAGGLDAVTGIRRLVTAAAASRAVLRPPVALNPGWVAVIAWLMTTTGVVAGWVALAFRRPAAALLIPLPVAGIAAISVPPRAQVASGIALIVLFVAGLGVLTGIERDPDEERRPLSYEIARAVRALPLVAVITVILVLLARADVLFPRPIFDPTQTPQKPKTTPLSEVEDRVLFEVESKLSGPWRMGVLDVYDGKDWRLPPVALSRQRRVPRSGIVDPELPQTVEAAITVRGMEGAVLPGLPNTVGLVAEGDYTFDRRSGIIRVFQGSVTPGRTYKVVASGVPSLDELRKADAKPPAEIAGMTEMPPPPSAVKDLISRAPKTSRWDTFDYLRNQILNAVTSTGEGVPVSVTPERIQDMIAGTREGSPFEIVAAQAMVARWAGVPARIGFGFDGGDLVDGKLHVRPRHGATFVEVWFPAYKWLAVIGAPRKAKPSVGSATEQQRDPNVLPSEDVAVQIYLPVVTPARSVLLDRVRTTVAAAAGLAFLLALAYVLYPLLRKAVLRARRRSAAAAAGPRERIELAYSEWRDLLTDFGYAYRTEPPLKLLDRFGYDEDHTELAWLVTRTLWGDLRHEISDEHASAAEELSRTLRRRLGQAHPATVRAVAMLSRLALRHPFNPGFDLLIPRERKRAA